MLATTLILLLPEIPKEIDGVLRIDGHTDDRPTAVFTIPFQLGAVDRARSGCVEVSGEPRHPDHRLAAAGFAEFRPIDTSGTEEGRRKNRRIEIKMD